VRATNTFGADGLISRHLSKPYTGFPNPMGGYFYTFFYAFDERGNTVQRVFGGMISSSRMSDAYGATTEVVNVLPVPGKNAGPPPILDPFGFGGKWGYYTDEETGLVLCTFRYYDPRTGRWLTRDPIGYDGGTNLYEFCANNPVTGVDPSGLIVNFLVGAGTSVGIGIGVATAEYMMTGKWNYSWGQAAFDAATGAIGVGVVSKLAKLRAGEKLAEAGVKLFWHGSAERVANKVAGGILEGGAGAMGGQWATPIPVMKTWLQKVAVGGTAAVFGKGKSLEAAYELSQAEIAMFSKAQGFAFHLNPLAWWKGRLLNQYFCQVGSKTAQQLLIEYLSVGATIGYFNGMGRALFRIFRSEPCTG